MMSLVKAPAFSNMAGGCGGWEAFRGSMTQSQSVNGPVPLECELLKYFSFIFYPLGRPGWLKQAGTGYFPSQVSVML